MVIRKNLKLPPASTLKKTLNVLNNKEPGLSNLIGSFVEKLPVVEYDLEGNILGFMNLKHSQMYKKKLRILQLRVVKKICRF